MAERLWIPAAYVDEICPSGRASPDAWIGASAGDVWLLATDEDLDLGLTLKPGEVVQFEWVERLGAARIAIRDDGTHAALDPVPAGVNVVSFGTEVIADSLDDFVREWREAGLELDEDGSVLVDMARWSEDDEAFQFDICERGPRFIRPNPPRAAAQPRHQGGAS